MNFFTKKYVLMDKLLYIILIFNDGFLFMNKLVYIILTLLIDRDMFVKNFVGKSKCFN